MITFRNVAHVQQTQQSLSPSSHFRSQGSGRERWKESLPLQGTSKSIGHTRNSSFSQETFKAHTPALSLTSPVGTRQNSTTSLNQAASAEHGNYQGKHRRSISIVSLANDPYRSRQTQDSVASASPPNGSGHARAASLQLLPRRGGVRVNELIPATASTRASTFPSPLLRTSTSTGTTSPRPPADVSPLVRPGGSSAGQTPKGSRRPSYSISHDHRSPNVPSFIEEHREGFNIEPLSKSAGLRHNDTSGKLCDINPATRVLSESSVNGTPKSSGEFYSMSNHSSETLASDFIGHDRARRLLPPPQSWQMSSLSPNKRFRQPEVLMMGYGHIIGSFTLDSSLINQSPFEEVKRKGIIGDQGGGGVVRAEPAKRESGLFSFSGWGNIGESFGGLLGGGELSTIKEKTSSSNAKSIPILSTPQSIFFVDLQLRPGESKSYTYRHRLPRGIPPTHKGRAMKVAYSLVVGSQRAAKMSHKHNVQHVDIPFRVLAGVNDQGDTLGHDLMSPHIILKDEARTAAIESSQVREVLTDNSFTTRRRNSSSQSFLSYVESMLERQRQSSGIDLLSPSENGERSLTPTSEQPKSMKEAIDLAILKSNLAGSSKQSTNRFEITRGGDRIAAVLLARPSFRLGETVPVVVSFEDSDIPCYSLHATLESSESVDPTIALRSKASILRVTRRVHASHFDSTLFSQRSFFSPVIPINSTPEFLTSGISLTWRLRFEFVTRRLKSKEETDSGLEDFLEDIAQDERGIIRAGIQSMPCETFDVTIPLHVYGATAATDEMHTVGGFPI